MTEHARPAIVEYTCDCAELGKYHWIKERGDYTCPYCGRTLQEEREIHRRVEWDFSLYVSQKSR